MLHLKYLQYEGRQFLNNNLNVPALYLEQENILTPFFIILRSFTKTRNILYFTSYSTLSSPLLLVSGAIEELILSVVISIGEKNITYRKTWPFESQLKVENSSSQFYLTFLQKRDHRLTALAKTDWTPTVKDEVQEVLNLAYTSSDESSYEYDSDSERRVLASYKTKHLPWERTRLTKVKKCLDAVYEKGLTRRVRQSRVPRELHEEQSDRDK